jgi:hypothetical protein
VTVSGCIIQHAFHQGAKFDPQAQQLLGRNVPESRGVMLWAVHIPVNHWALKRHFWAKTLFGHFLPKTMRIVTKLCQ